MSFLSRYRFALGALVAVVIAAVVWFAFNPLEASGGRPDRIVVVTKTGEHPFTVEWATTSQEREHGLMFRESMAPDHGMVFDFMVEQDVSFWMKNTPLALDMIFIHADGTVARIARNTVPFSETPVPSGSRVRYVFEVVAGTADRIGLIGGDKVRLD
jgi:uncharacterized membrane protein (UPF0127 family)